MCVGNNFITKSDTYVASYMFEYSDLAKYNYSGYIPACVLIQSNH